jgi:RNA polymerase sigma-70 factor, ECF subfamily
MPSAPALGVIDDDLVLRSQAGDPVATGELVRLARPVLQRYARRFFPDPARAEDMAQTALMKAFARMGDLRSPEAFQTWLLRIARNECLNELTRHRVAQIPMSTLEDQGTLLEAPAGGADDPEEQLVRTQMQSLVRRVAAGLPQHYRATLTMRALEDRSYEEISEALDIPVTVARLWYCRARKRFRTAFIQALVERRDVPAECQEMGSAIAELIEGTLSRAKRDTVQAHLVDCSACRQTEDELRNTAFRAPARVMLIGLGLARLPGSLRRSVTSMSGRTQQLAGEIALGAAGTFVLAATNTLGGAPAPVQAAGPSGSQAVAQAPASGAAAGLYGSRVSWSGQSEVPSGDGTSVLIGVPAVAVAVPLIDPALAPSLGNGLSLSLPSHPSLTLTQRRLNHALGGAKSSAGGSAAALRTAIDSLALEAVSN